jgi:hypothetical protein
MRPLLARAFAQASRLPPDEQDALAAFMIATLADGGGGSVHEPAPEDFGGKPTHASGPLATERAKR